MKAKGLYIHVPFCKRKCPYCDFFSVTNLSLTDRYTDAVIRNITDKSIFADTVYFGGGTPSLLSTEQIYRILSKVKISQDAEITMECNPNTVMPKYLSDIKNAGINRISFGVQSLNDNELSALGRLHNAETAAIAIKSAYDAGFDNISADIMLATAYQTPSSLNNTLSKLSQLPITHVSAYMLKVEPDTPYGSDTDLQSILPDDDSVADMYLQTVETLASFGFEQYEISNFSKSNFESKHNLKYWKCNEYYGIGPSAHSFLSGVRKACPKSIDDFISSPVQKDVIIEADAGDFEEQIMLALRLTKIGLNLDLLPENIACDILKKAKPMLFADLMRKNKNALLLTAKGCLVSNEIICRLLT